MSPSSKQVIEFCEVSKGELLFVTLEVFGCLASAWLIKFGKDMSRVKLPPVANIIRLSSRGFTFAVALTDMAITHGARWTGRKCFFRAFILANVLRRRGVPVSMNVGLCGVDGKTKGKRIDGHCWLTLNNKPYLEEVDWREQYPHFLTRGINGICYWMGTIKYAAQPK